jgi:predicted nuclease of predicted toxin-antitoxin system
MRILLDECVPRRLKRDLGNHEVQTVPEMGWAGMKNRALLQRAAEYFDVLLTTDRNLTFQQNMAKVRLGILVMHAPSK